LNKKGTGRGRTNGRKIREKRRGEKKQGIKENTSAGGVSGSEGGVWTNQEKREDGGYYRNDRGRHNDLTSEYINQARPAQKRNVPRLSLQSKEEREELEMEKSMTNSKA